MQSATFRTIMVPLDGSELGESAVGLAVSICSQSGAALHLVHVQEHPEIFAIAQDSSRYVATVAHHAARTLGRPVTSALLEDEIGGVVFPSPPRRTIADILYRYAQNYDVDLIVLSSHGRRGVKRAWLGSVADALIREARIPVLLRRSSGTDSQQRIGSVLIALDGSERSEACIRPAAELARITASRITLLNVIPMYNLPQPGRPVPYVAAQARVVGERALAAGEYLRGVAAALRAEGFDAETAVVESTSVAGAILEFARRHKADAIAVATRGHGGAKRAFLGSVADAVVRSAAVPVLVCSASTNVSTVPLAEPPIADA